MPDVLTARFELPADVKAAGRARRLITSLLAAWGRAEHAEVAELLVSEVVTNAVCHAHHGDPVLVHVRAEPDRVRIAVGDSSTQLPVVRPKDLDGESGRGMHLVAALASEWGVLRQPVSSGAGKQVWFELTAAQGAPA